MWVRKVLTGNKNAVLAIAHQMVTAVYGFGLLLLLYRVAPKQEIGRWILLSSCISLCDMMIHGFLQTPAIRKISMSDNKKRFTNIVATNALLFAAGIWILISLTVYLVSSIFSSVQLLHDLRWYSILGGFMALYNVCWWIGNALSDFKAVLYQRLIFSVSSLVFILILFIQKGKLNAESIIVSQIAGYWVSALVALVYIRKIRFKFTYIDKELLGYFFNYGRFTAGSMIMGSLLRNADVFMIASFMSEGAVAVYSAAQKMVEIFEIALRGMASHALPEFCRSATSFEVLMKKYIRITSLLLLLFIPVATGMFIFSNAIIHLLSGSVAYDGAVVVLRVFMVYVLFLVVDRMTGVTLEAMGLASYNLVKTVLLVVVNIVGNAVALYYFHSLAAVAAVSILAATMGIVSGAYFIMLHSGITITWRRVRTGFNMVLG